MKEKQAETKPFEFVASSKVFIFIFIFCVAHFHFGRGFMEQL